jgi:enoyl-CoA hydratase
MDSDVLIVEKRGDVDWVTMNRPDSLNALNGDLIEALASYFEQRYRDHATRIVVLTGAGRGYCSGADLGGGSLVGAANDAGRIQIAMRTQRRIGDIYRAMRRCPQPIISLVNGAAAGGGFALVLASDIRIARPRAKMNAAFIRIGLTACDMGSSYFLPRLVGSAVASDLLLTGRFIEAEEALTVGLVNRVVDETQLESAAQDYIDQMLATSPIGLRMTKEALDHAIDAQSLDAAMALEDRQQILTLQTADHVEAISAFIEKRAPKFEDR